LNDQGHVLWDRYLQSGAFWQEPYDIALVGNTGYVITGFERTTTSGETVHPVVIRVDTQGDTLWTLHLRQYVFGEAETIHVMDDGGYIISGDYAGDFFCARTAPDPASSRDTPIPAKISLLRAYPNPFNAATTIEFPLMRNSKVNVALYDICGRHVMTLVDGVLASGTHQIGLNDKSLPTGVYICNLRTPFNDASLRLVLVK
jgi:hypothetical protein